MCGIGGASLKSGRTVDLNRLLARMTTRQHHRGPDGQGIWIAPDGRAGLAHNRLAIIETGSGGTQPMTSADGRLTIAFNGEIYNYRALREELTARGTTFRTHSDTEVLLAAYAAWGEGMLDRLRGMFAFALHDSLTGTTLCARDRVGKKPFVYGQTDEGVFFASEIPALREIPGIDRTLDPAALAAMLQHNLRHIPDPWTAYQGLKRLRAGHAMILRDGRIEKIERYWTPTPAEGPVTPARLRETLEESVRLRLQADVPVGALLSGGIDSTAIVGLMRKFSETPIHTYALGMDANDEDLRRARLAAQALGTTHREFYFDPEEQWDIFRRLTSTYGEPVMLLPMTHTYALCRAIYGDGIKVVLSGNGADELFYGYTGHIRTLKISHLLDRIAPLRPLLAPCLPGSLAWLAAPPGQRKATWYAGQAPATWRQYMTPAMAGGLADRAAEELAFWGSLCPSPHYIDESNFVGLMVENTHSVTTIGDLPAMMASVEMRAPFLDQEIIALALATAAEDKIPDPGNPDRLKAILRDAVSDLIPPELLNASKRGFGMGIQERDVLRGPWRAQADAAFADPHDAGGLLDPDRIRKAWKIFKEDGKKAHQIAKLFAMQVWLKDSPL